MCMKYERESVSQVAVGRAPSIIIHKLHYQCEHCDLHLLYLAEIAEKMFLFHINVL